MMQLRRAILTAGLLLGLPVVGLGQKVGEQAPALRFTSLLQAPPGTRTSWAALRGKVVVLEFWATWCGPCLVSIPHLNQLAASVDARTVQFISIDDEAPDVVQGFLAKRTMAGWSAMDTSGRVFRDYSVSARPTTIVVDKGGRISAIIDPETLKAEDLTALAAEKPVRFDAAVAPTTNKLISPNSGSESTPLFEVSLRNSAPNTKSGYTESGGVFVMHGQTPLALLMYAYATAEDRILEVSPLSQNLYNVEALFAGADDATRKLALQAAVISGLHLQVTPKLLSRKVYVLRSTSQSQTLLVPTASTGGRMSGYSKGEEKIELIRASMDDLASSLEAALGQPVVNESEVSGRFDGELRIPFENGTAAKKELATVMGLDLIEQERLVPMLEVQSSSQPARMASAHSPEK